MSNAKKNANKMCKKKKRELQETTGGNWEVNREYERKYFYKILGSMKIGFQPRERETDESCGRKEKCTEMSRILWRPVKAS